MSTNDEIYDEAKKQMKHIIDNKMRPTEKSTRFMKVLGKEKTFTALSHGLLKLKFNEDNTFDVTLTNMMVNDLQQSLTDKLKERGYGLTQKGKQYLHEQYTQDNLDRIITDVGLERIKEMKKAPHKVYDDIKNAFKGDIDG